MDNMIENKAKPASNMAVKLSPAYPRYSQVCHNILFDKKKRSLYLVGVRGWARKLAKKFDCHLHHLLGTCLKEETSED